MYTDMHTLIVQKHTHTVVHTMYIDTHTHALCDRTNKVGISASVARIPVLLAPE